MHLNGAVALFIMLFSTAACSKGGNLVLEPGARPIKSKGSPFLSVNQGGTAHLVEQGKTETTGVHGFVTIQPIKTTKLSGAGGVTGVVNNAIIK